VASSLIIVNNIAILAMLILNGFLLIYPLKVNIPAATKTILLKVIAFLKQNFTDLKQFSKLLWQRTLVVYADQTEVSCSSFPNSITATYSH